jgi:L,D-transpeptidase YcbB
MDSVTVLCIDDRPQVPVLILYATVIVLEDGVVHFYDDIYRHDAALDKALAKGYPYGW